MDTLPTPARLVQSFAFVALLDNHEPARDTAHGIIERWEWPDDGRVSWRIPDGVSTFKEATRAVFLMDDGRSVRPLYVAGWSGARDCVFLEDMPVNVHDDGTARVCADNGRPVDYSTWALGPRRAYHLKITDV